MQVCYIGESVAILSVSSLALQAADALGNSPSQIEHLTLTGALVGAVVVLWRSYSNTAIQRVAENEKLRELLQDSIDEKAKLSEAISGLRDTVENLSSKIGK